MTQMKRTITFQSQTYTSRSLGAYFMISTIDRISSLFVLGNVEDTEMSETQALLIRSLHLP